MGKRYIRECRICHETFIAPSFGRVYCSPECKRAGTRETERKRYAAKMDARRKSGNLDEVLAELDRYNKEHGTCISYGKWVHMQRIQKGTKQ